MQFNLVWVKRSCGTMQFNFIWVKRSCGTIQFNPVYLLKDRVRRYSSTFELFAWYVDAGWDTWFYRGLATAPTSTLISLFKVHMFLQGWPPLFRDNTSWGVRHSIGVAVVVQLHLPNDMSLVVVFLRLYRVLSSLDRASLQRDFWWLG